MTKKHIFLVLLMCILAGCANNDNILENDISSIEVRMHPSPPQTYIFKDKKDVEKIINMLNNFEKQKADLEDLDINGWDIWISFEGEEQSIRILGEYMIRNEQSYRIEKADVEMLRKLIIDLNAE